MHLKKQKDVRNTKLAVIPPECGQDLTFEKLAYVIPTSMNLPLMTDRSILRATEKVDASVKDKKGKKDKKDKDKDKETSGSRTPLSNAGGAGGVRASKDRVTVSSRRTSVVGDYGQPRKPEPPSPLLKNINSEAISEDYQPATLQNAPSQFSHEYSHPEIKEVDNKRNVYQQEPHPSVKQSSHHKSSHHSGTKDLPKSDTGFTEQVEHAAIGHQRNDKTFVSFNNNQ